MAASCISKSEAQNIANNLFGDCKVSCYEVKPFCESTRGYLGSHYLITLSIETEKGNKEVKLFGKCGLTGNLTACFEDSQLYEKEAFTYEFLQTAKSLVPSIRCDILPRMITYLERSKTLVLENLCEKGYKSTTTMTYDKEHMFRALEAVARFHSVSMAYEMAKSKELGRKYEMDQEYGDILVPVFSSNKNHCGNKFIRSCEIGAMTIIDYFFKDSEKRDALKADISKLINELFNLLNNKTGFTNVLCHGDLWSFNFLFKYDSNNKPSDCKLVDFQFIRYTPPAHDVTMMIYMASDKASFQKNVHEYYNHYYVSLEKELKRLHININTVLPKDQFERSCRLYMPIGKLIWLCYRESSQAKEENFAKIADDLDTVKDVILSKGRRWFVKENLETDDYYRMKIKEIFEDVRLAMKTDILSIEDCYHIANQKVGNAQYQILDYNVALMDKKLGYLGDHSFLNMKLSVDNKEKNVKFFVKTRPTTQAHKDFVAEIGAATKEMLFFGNIVPAMQKHGIDLYKEYSAKCYLAQENVLVFECLATQGYKIASVRECMSMQNIKSSLTSMAKLHASGILLEEKIKETQPKATLNTIYPTEFEETLYNNSRPISARWMIASKLGFLEQVKMFQDKASVITPENYHRVGSDLIDMFPELTKASKKYRNTICHGDLWGSNMMFKEDHCILVDFQTYRYCPPASDLMQFIYLSTTQKWRSDYKEELINYYYEEFKKYIEAGGLSADEILPYSDFRSSCEEESVFAIAQAVTHFQVVMMSPDRALEIVGDPEFYEKAFFIDRSEHIKICASTDPMYYGRTKESIQDFRKLCENYVN